MYKRKISTTMNLNQFECGPDGRELPEKKDWVFLVTVVPGPCTSWAHSW